MPRTLSTSAMVRIKAELHDTVATIAAGVYIDIRSIYDVIQGAVVGSDIPATSTATAVTVAGNASLVLASIAGIEVGTKLVLDVDAAREVVTVRSVTGSTVSVLCRQTHAGTYPVEIESGVTIVEGILAELDTVALQRRQQLSSAGVKRVDEIEFFGGTDGVNASIDATAESLRKALGQALGLDNIRRASHAGGCSFEAY